jgi:hypothetical protein
VIHRAIKYIFITGVKVLMRILVVNNYGQFNHLIVRSIRDFVESKLISNQTPPEWRPCPGACRQVC